jgi:hypothetical protein
LPGVARADGLGSLQGYSGKWGANVHCSTGYDEIGQTIRETCRTVNYCRMRLTRRDIKIGRCRSVAPWQQGTRTS